MSSDILKDRHVIFEILEIGAYIKITAMDTQSLTEISIQGPAQTPKNILKNNALRRLKYVLEKKNIIPRD